MGAFIHLKCCIIFDASPVKKINKDICQKKKIAYKAESIKWRLWRLQRKCLVNFFFVWSVETNYVLYQIYEIHFRWQILVLLHHTVPVRLRCRALNEDLPTEREKKIIALYFIFHFVKVMCEWVNERLEKFLYSFSTSFFWWTACKSSRIKIWRWKKKNEYYNNLIWYFCETESENKTWYAFAGVACKIRQCDR